MAIIAVNAVFYVGSPASASSGPEPNGTTVIATRRLHARGYDRGHGYRRLGGAAPSGAGETVQLAQQTIQVYLVGGFGLMVTILCAMFWAKRILIRVSHPTVHQPIDRHSHSFPK